MSRFDDYIREISEQIRVKRIRETLTGELRDHLEMQKADFMEQGMEADEAERLAIEDMGDALVIGGELDRVHRPKMQWKGMILAFVLMLIGILMRTVFTPTGLAEPVSSMQCAGVCVAMGGILLLGMTDYMQWIRWATALMAAWLVLLVLKILDGPSAVSYYLPLRIDISLLMRVTIEQVALAAPVLTALMICRKRGGGRKAFAACMAVPAAVVAMGISYTWLYYTPDTVMTLALLCIALLMMAVKKGFFRIRRRGAYIALGGLAAVALMMLVLIQTGELAVPDYIATEYVYPLLRQARMWGADRMDAELIARSYELYSNDLMLPFIIYRFGWAAFAAVTAAVVGALSWAGRKFARMENRIGSFMGMSCVMTFGLQTVLYYIHSFTIFSWPLGFPLISYGTIVLWIDAAMIGLMLSILRGENLPEKEYIESRKRSGGIAA